MKKRNIHIKEIYTLKTKDCIVAWTDFLAFGIGLDTFKWKLNRVTNDEDFKILWRLNKIKPILHSIGGLASTSLALNDSFVHNIDVNEKKNFDHLGELWLKILKIFKYHHRINQSDIEDGFPGIRTIITAGERLISSKVIKGSSLDQDNYFYEEKFKPDITELNLPKLDPFYYWERSQNKKLKRITTYTPNEFHLNLAFSKAYILDDMGSNYGLTGPALYIDKSFLDLLMRKRINPNYCCTSKADSWNYFIEYFTNKNQTTFSIIQKDYNNNKKNIGKLFLKKLDMNLHTRFGKTSIYKLLQVNDFYLPLNDKRELHFV